jgi:glycosyltransferase involved in cell wall biosynthesis
MKMCDALSGLGNQIILLKPAYGDIDKQNQKYVSKYYGLENELRVQNVRTLRRPYIFPIISVCLMSLVIRLNNKIDIVYSRDVFSCMFNALTGAKVVFEMHQPSSQFGKFSRILIKLLFKMNNFCLLVVITESLRKWFESHYPKVKTKLAVFPDGADFHTLGELKSRSRKKTFKVGYVGHLYPGKGMEIISQLVKRLDDLQFEIIGGAQQDLKKWKKELNDSPNVKFHGHVEHSKICTAMADFDVLLAPLQEKVIARDGTSDIGQWTSPLKIFEYMSAGKPIIASDLPVLREVLTHGRNALMCSPTNVEGWEKALYDIKNDSLLAKKLARNARCDLKDMYSWKKRAQNIIKRIDYVCANKMRN